MLDRLGDFLKRRLRPTAREGLTAIGVEAVRLVYPAEPPLVYAIGDVHGRLDLLLKLEARLQKDRKSRRRKALIVMLGDMIDRGPSSAQIIDHVMGAPPTGFERVCVMGNHEALMLQFLADPRPDSIWLSQGGRETLISYGAPESAFAGAGRRALAQLAEAYVPAEHIEFLKSMPVLLETPGRLYVHAGIDKNYAIPDQPDEALMWYRDDFAETYEGLGRQVIHGHSFTREPLVLPFRVAIDTGAYHTGILTAAAFSASGAPRLINVVDGQDAG